MQRISGIHQSIENDEVAPMVQAPVKKAFPIRKWLSIAATVLVLALLYFVIDSARMSPGLLASSFYNDYYVVNERSEVASNAHTITGSFVRKDYKDVIDQYSKIQAPGQRERFLAGFSWYKLGDYAKAAKLFEEIMSYNKKAVVPLYNDEASYFLALSCLHLNDYDKAYTLLNGISRNKNHTYNQTVSPGSLSRLWVKKTFY
jgi:tetratricopeptide (TPR) repeat protein